MTNKTRLGILLLPEALCGCMTDSPLTATPEVQAVMHSEPLGVVRAPARSTGIVTAQSSRT